MGQVTITIIEQVDSNRVIVKCSLCRGSGRKPGYSSHVACEICGGKGVVLVQCTPPLVKCALCVGSGRKPGYSSHVPCDQCQGIGAQPLTGSMKVLR